MGKWAVHFSRENHRYPTTCRCPTGTETFPWTTKSGPRVPRGKSFTWLPWPWCAREQSFTPTSTLQVLSVPFQIDLACLRVEQVPRAHRGHLVICGKSSLPLGWNMRLRPTTTIVHYLFSNTSATTSQWCDYSIYPQSTLHTGRLNFKAALQTENYAQGGASQVFVFSLSRNL